ERARGFEARGEGKPLVEGELLEPVDPAAFLGQDGLVGGIRARSVVDDARDQAYGAIEIPRVDPEHLRPDEPADRPGVEVAPGHAYRVDRPRVRRVGLVLHRVEQVRDGTDARQLLRGQELV